MKIKEVSNYLESIAPRSYQESYDNSGLLVGDPGQEVSGILVSLDCTEEVVEEAKEKGCNLIVAHHPIIFKGLKRLTGANYVERTVIKAIQSGVAIYAIHTNLDNVHQGVNAKICERLGIKNPKILVPKSGLLKKLYTFCPLEKVDEVRQAIFSGGAGVIGAYDQCSFNVEGFGTFRGGNETNPYVGEKGELHREAEVKIEVIFPAPLQGAVISQLLKAHPYEEVAYDIINLDNKHHQVGSGMVGELSEPISEMEFLQGVKEKMEAPLIRHTALLSKPVKRVAVCGGSGSFLLRSAIGAGADVFITADFKYHEFFDAENKIVIADLGHYESEQFTKDLLVEMLQKKIPTFAVHLSNTSTNPINYL